MPAASLDAMLELWSTSLREAKHRIPAAVCGAERGGLGQHVPGWAALDGLLGAGRRKTGWMRAEAAGDPGPWRQQAVLGRSHWDADALRDVVREHAVETLADPAPCWSSTRRVFSSRARHPVACIASTRAQPARSPTARLGYSPPMSRTKATPSSIGPSTCPRPGRTTVPAERPYTCRRTSPLSRSRSLRS